MNSQFISVDREAIWVALFNHIKNASPLSGLLQTVGRKHVMPPDLNDSQQPALFVCQIRETHEPRPQRAINRLILHGFLFLYVKESATQRAPGTETQLAATDLNTILKAVDDAFLPDRTDGVFTLGGLVSHCWLEGDTDQDPGIFGQQAAAVIPVHMLVP